MVSVYIATSNYNYFDDKPMRVLTSWVRCTPSISKMHCHKTNRDKYFTELTKVTKFSNTMGKNQTLECEHKHSTTW